MKNYKIPEKPNYNSTIRKLENTDSASADIVFNPLFQQIIENIHAVKQSDDTKAENDLSNVKAQKVLDKIIEVSGFGGGLNADTVDGKNAADLQNYDNLTNKPKLKAVAVTGNYNDLENKPNLRAVAITGNYNDLENKPIIPTTLPANGGNADTVDGKHAADLQNYNNLLNKPNLKAVATTGNYNDLGNKPTIPTTLPANGGNADTVDGKHSNDLCLSDKKAFQEGETILEWANAQTTNVTKGIVSPAYPPDNPCPEGWEGTVEVIHFQGNRKL